MRYMRSTREEILNDKIQILSVFLIFILLFANTNQTSGGGGGVQRTEISNRRKEGGK